MVSDQASKRGFIAFGGEQGHEFFVSRRQILSLSEGFYVIKIAYDSRGFHLFSLLPPSGEITHLIIFERRVEPYLHSKRSF
jgi:hypothetical protein